MPRLRRVSSASPGWQRRRTGRGFHYTDATGRALDADQIARVRSLAIPPAWRDVWICPVPNGHLQATGLDAAGRRQYLYHPQWRELRDRQKFDRVLAAAVHLPEAREQITHDLAEDGMPLHRATAVAVRLLDLGYFRIGNDLYADAHGSFGLTTLERRHVRRHGSDLVFRFVGKSGVRHVISIADSATIEALDVMRRRRDGSPRLLAYRRCDGWADLSSALVNTYLGDLFHGELTAKDFRTWHATVIAADTLALAAPATSAAARRRAVRAAVDEVAHYLGNTPALAKSSYIDPRVLDLYESGITIGDAARREYRRPEDRQEAVERALLDALA